MEKTQTCRLAERDGFLTASDAELTDACDLDFFRSTGNGGQKKNKTSSAVRLIHRPTNVAVTDGAERSQHRNRASALRKLRLAIAFSCRADELKLPERSDVGLSNPEYPLFAARLLDLLDSCGFRISDAAAQLNLSSSRLNNILARDPALHALANRERHSRGLPPLRQNR